MDKYDVLKLDNQLCFRLYACGKEITRLYKPFLDEIGLTYTQYISMMVIWEEKKLTLKRLGDRIFLDSGTLTPLVRKLEEKGYVQRKKDEHDDRNLMIEVTEKGLDLRDKALSVPSRVSSCIKLEENEAIVLYGTLKKILKFFEENQK